jgi:3-oxoacyl-[acyl-carrier protein] reductase
MAIETGLRDRVVIVTGGSAGIGRVTAQRFVEEGCKVVVWDLVDAPGDEGVTFMPVNVTKTAEVEAAVAEVISRFGSVDVLVNNAGILRDAQLIKWKDGAIASQMTDEAFDSVLAVNFRGPFVCTRAVAPQMIKAGRGVILNASSVVGLYGNFGQTNYAATKAAVINMTATWSRELGKFGIRVNAVAPGFIATEMVKAMPPKVLDNMVAHTPIGRMGEPIDIANAYVWLASDAASFVTGTCISVDGGIVIGT